MDHEPPIRRRRARAIAIRATADAQRKAIYSKLIIALASAAVIFEAVAITRHWLAVAH